MNDDKKPPNYRYAECCKLCEHSEPPAFFFNKLKDEIFCILHGGQQVDLSGVCDDYEQPTQEAI